MENENFMKAHSIKEVSLLTGVPPGTLRQWESDFTGLLEIPRDENKSRYYTDFEIEMINHIKQMREKNISKTMIKELLEKRSESEPEKILQPTVPSLRQSEVVETLQGIQKSLETFPEVRDLIISDIKKELHKEMKDFTETLLNQTSEQFKEVSESFKKMESNYKNELEKRDKVSMENMRLLSDLKEEKRKNELLEFENKSLENKSWFSKLFKQS